MRCGLLGGKLGHSYSPRIHAELGGYEYRLYEKAPEELAAFLAAGEFDGLNVTIPYKKAVVPYCAELSDAARTLGSVNTLLRRKDGSLYGDNTDLFGFTRLAETSGIPAAGRKALVFGSGGASATVCAALRALGAAEVTVISRGGTEHYGNLERHAEAGVLVNTTPLGMYPDNGGSPADLRRFPRCAGVLDVVYNPERTALLLQAEALGIPCAGGLRMLVAQAKRSSELFSGRSIDDGEIDRIEALLRREMRNVILIGMPGCGKTAVGRALAAAMGRPFFDADEAVEAAADLSVPALFARFGEEGFRERETEALRELGKRSGAVIATGGGAVLREENYPLLRQNGTIVWLRRELSRLPTDGRPLSRQSGAEELWRVRAPRYRRFAELTAENNGTVGETVQRIQKMLA